MKIRRTLVTLLGMVLCCMLVVGSASAEEKMQQTTPKATSQGDATLGGLHKQILVQRGFSEAAKKCIECHSKATPGIVDNWRNGRMAHAQVSCYDCHVVEKTSPMASQCEGVRGTNIYTSPMVSSKTCSRCHPVEVSQFLESSHAKPASEPVMNNPTFDKLMYYYEGLEFAGVDRNSPEAMAPRASGCQMCHGTIIQLGADNKPINMTWPGGPGQRYPDGSVGNCSVCHTRHMFSIAEARKPESCGTCHLGPDHPNIEIYDQSKHGQVYAAHSEKWNFTAAPDTWEPGDYDAPTCAVCHLSGIGELTTTHNPETRLKWTLYTKRSEIREGTRGAGVEGGKRMRLVCKNCHSTLHTNATMDTLDASVKLYNIYWDKAVAMKKELAAKNLLGDDPWRDGFQRMMYYLWHHEGRRARQGAAMNGPDYAHWHGFFQMFQMFMDMQGIRDWRIKNGKIEELSNVACPGPD